MYNAQNFSPSTVICLHLHVMSELLQDSSQLHSVRIFLDTGAPIPGVQLNAQLAVSHLLFEIIWNIMFCVLVGSSIELCSEQQIETRGSGGVG